MSSIKVGQNIEQGIASDPALARYASKLKAMDKDGNGVLELDEVCQAIDVMVQQESQNRLLKKVAIVSGILSLLTIATVVGLTAAVIVLSKDIEDNDNVLRSTSSGSAMATAEYLNADGLEDILTNPDPVALSSIKTLMVYGGDGVDYTIHSVVSTTVKSDGSVAFKLADGQTVGYMLNENGQVVDAAAVATSTESTATRKLMGGGNGGGGNKVDTSSCVCNGIAPPTTDPCKTYCTSCTCVNGSQTGYTCDPADPLICTQVISTNGGKKK